MQTSGLDQGWQITAAMPVFESVSLETVCPFICIVYGCFHTAMTKLSSCHRDHIPCEAKNICSLTLCRKGLLTLDLCECDVVIVIALAPATVCGTEQSLNEWMDE